MFQPDWFPIGDLRATVDWYEIEITDVIAAFGAQFFLNDCYRNQANPPSCARITRNAGDGPGLLGQHDRGNQGTFATEGVDIQLEWSVPIGPGQLTVNELYSILDSFQFNGNEFAGTSTAAIGALAGVQVGSVSLQSLDYAGRCGGAEQSRTSAETRLPTSDTISTRACSTPL